MAGYVHQPCSQGTPSFLLHTWGASSCPVTESEWMESEWRLIHGLNQGKPLMVDTVTGGRPLHCCLL